MANTLTFYKNIDVDESEDDVSTIPVRVHWIIAVNVGSATAYLKLYNTNTVTVGTTVPDMTIPIPAQADGNGAGFVIQLNSAIYFDTALTIAATTGVADNDAGAPGANEVIVNLGYTT